MCVCKIACIRLINCVCMHMCAWMCACMHVFMFLCMCSYMFANICRYMHDTYVCTYVWYICLPAACLPANVCMFVCMYVYICLYIMYYVLKVCRYACRYAWYKLHSFKFMYRWIDEWISEAQNNLKWNCLIVPWIPRELM